MKKEDSIMKRHHVIRLALLTFAGVPSLPAYAQVLEREPAEF